MTECKSKSWEVSDEFWQLVEPLIPIDETVEVMETIKRCRNLAGGVAVHAGESK